MFFLWMMLLDVSFAQDENEDALQKAKQAYKYGEQLFNEGNYPDAITAFSRAYELTHRYQLLFNLALSYQFSADLVQARYYFEEYQRLAPADQWNEAQLRIDNIDAILASKESQETKEEEDDKEVRLPQQSTSIQLPKWASPVLWSVGTVGVASGLYFGIQSKSDGEMANEYCQDGICVDSAETFISSARISGAIADVAWGVGLTALGGVLWFQINKQSSVSCTPSSLSIRGVF